MDNLTQKLIRRCLINRDCTIDDIYHIREFQELVSNRVINQDKVRHLQPDGFNFEYVPPSLGGQQLVYNVHENEHN